MLPFAELTVGGIGDRLTGRDDGFLDALSEADWDRLVSAVVGVNTSVVDPKGIRQIGSAGDQTSDESSKPPERLA